MIIVERRELDREYRKLLSISAACGAVIGVPLALSGQLWLGIAVFSAIAGYLWVRSTLWYLYRRKRLPSWLNEPPRDT